MKRPVRPQIGGTASAEADLEAALERARESYEEERAFFRRLLDATVYVHAPVSDDSKTPRLVQFRHPDGFDAIPFFLSLAKAQVASSSAVKILAVVGRDLLAGTRGATLMFNPNDGGSVLYPEEVATLLETGFLARVEKLPTSAMDVRPARSAPSWLGPAISASLQQASFVSAAYVLETAPSATGRQQPGLLIWLVADMVHAERAARLVMTAIQPLCGDLDFIIDLTVHDMTKPLPEPLEDPELVPVFTRMDRPHDAG